MELTKTFENYFGKKVSQEQIDLVQKEGYLEFGREDIKGGQKVTLGKMRSGLIGTKKVRVFLIDEMPSDDVINKDFPLVAGTFVIHGAQGEKHEGTYGMANGRKFFCIGKSKAKHHVEEPASEPVAASTEKKRR